MALTIHTKRAVKVLVGSKQPGLPKETIRKHIDLIALRLFHIEHELAGLSRDREKLTAIRDGLVANHFPEEGEAISQLVTDVLSE
jgi:hypothetical protein